MADQKTTPDVEYDDEGKPIVKKDESIEGEGAEKKPDDSENKDGNTDKDEEAGTDKDFDDNAEPEIPVRKSPLQHIIARKNSKIKKLESRIEDKDENIDDEDDGGDEGDDGLTDEARGAIDKTVKKQIAPILKTLISDADENELKSLFTDEPEAKKYEKHIRAYMGHDVYKGVAPSVIYHHLAFKAAQAIGAKKRKVADLEAEQTKGGGRVLQPKGGASDLPTAEDIANMSEEEFESMETRARQGEFINNR